MIQAPPTRGVVLAALMCALAGLCLPVLAQVHKCTQADGSVAYQATPCASDAPPPERVTAAQLNAARRAQERARARAALAAASKPSAACRTTPASPTAKSASGPGRSSPPPRPC